MVDRIPTLWRDVAVAILFGGFSLANALHDDPTNPWVIAPTALAGVALVFRRSRPLPVLLTVSGCYAVALVAGSGAVIPVAVIAWWSAAALLPRQTAIRWGALASGVVLVVVLLDGSDRPSSSLASLVFLVGAWFAGDNLRVRREQQEERARRAVSDERARIARELHDVITHNVSVMVVQAAAGNDVFDERPDQAREALANVEQTGRRALGELRTLLAAVGEEERAPQPSLVRLDTLVDQVRRAGVGVDLAVEGTPRELPAAVDLSAYRIVQESLTNMLKHSRATRATVRVRYAPDELEVEVADDGVGAASTEGGRGLIGMRERVSLLGGELTASTRPGGGFAVVARMPVEAM